ncbi:hypothetical protein HELRODRAFT_170458 [Helobdella robusta]|uniref:Uncharacterized protein n=1 Tax=Helobdella robusta TaxID=6412 RepID=T1F332_HELRO|nr:hypothetical protein HELRODRAFT_170458 [Helobdella robusta]ESO07151.1 hypothetical protein HELRODRAFT_170458 [Helobdella robusta]
MWLVAKNSSLLSPDLTLIILHIALRILRVLGSIGPRTSIHIGKNSIEGVPIIFHFLVRCPGRGQTAFFTCQVYVSFGEGARDRNIPRQTSAGSPRAVRRAPSNSPNLEGSMCLDVRRKYINLGKLRALRILVKASSAERQETRPRANLSSGCVCVYDLELFEILDRMKFSLDKFYNMAIFGMELSKEPLRTYGLL